MTTRFTQPVSCALGMSLTLVVVLCGAVLSTLLTLVCAQTHDCGTSVVPLVTRGRPITEGEYPWLAALYQLDEAGQWTQFCGGALISPRFVITAAHCVYFEEEVIEPENIKVGLGKLYRDFYRDEDYAVIANVSRVVVHKSFYGALSRFSLDVALLRLSTVVETSDYVLPVCVDLDMIKEVQNGATVHAAGWGKSENESSTESALAADLSFLNNRQCLKQTRVAYRNYVTSEKFCALSINGSQVDRGDSGGALTYFKNDRHYIIGIVSTKIRDQTAFSILTDLSNLEIQSWLKNETDTLNSPGCGVLCANCGAEERVPWAVVIYAWFLLAWLYQCNGTLITPHIILTVYGCIISNGQEIALSNLKVGLGRLEYGYYLSEPNSVFADVREIIRASGSYNSPVLLDLAVRVQITDYIKPACIDLSNLNAPWTGTQGQVAGWGKYMTRNVNGTFILMDTSYNNRIETAKQTWVEPQQCPGIIPTDMFCTQMTIIGRGPYRFFEGAAFTVSSNEKHHVVGVTAGMYLFPDPAYDHVSLFEHNTWLKQQVARLKVRY